MILLIPRISPSLIYRRLSQVVIESPPYRRHIKRVMTSSVEMKQQTHPHYELLYHPGIPGRGEYIRLPLEAAGISYTDVANGKDGGYSKVQALMDAKSTGDEDGNPPNFAPPMLRVPGAGRNGKSLVIHQSEWEHFGSPMQYSHTSCSSKHTPIFRTENRHVRR
jgi:hypothetical protein